nr:hypothetical protein HEP87_19175 [Streptomyces sp. S1D4-11]
MAVRTRLKQLAPADEEALRRVGAHLGTPASRDLKARCADALAHDGEAWAARKRELTPLSSPRWAGAITKASHDQWALSRRCQLAHIQSLEAGISTIRHRLSLPLREKGGRRAPGGYRSKQEWHAKARRLHVLQDRLEQARTDRDVGVVHVVRGGKHLARTRHHLPSAQLTGAEWRQRWEAERWFLKADGESGKRFGNETIRVSADGEVSIKLPAPLKELANAPHDRTGIAVIAVDPAHTSKRGAQHWQKPLTHEPRKTTRHEAAAVAIGRCAQGHPVRRRTTPPSAHQSDVQGHRTVQAGPGTPGREGSHPRIPGPRTRCVPPDCGANAGNQSAQHRSRRSAEHEYWQQDSLPLSP